MNKIIPKNQAIYINSSQGRIFDFDNPSSRVYLGEAVNSLLKVFGNNVVISGFRILDVRYENNFVHVKISPGEAILDSTLVKYTSAVDLSINVIDYDDTGSIIPNIFFKFIQTQQKNLSSIRLSYVSNNNSSQSWFEDYCIVPLAEIKFDKTKQTAKKNIIGLIDRPRKTINNKEYTIYPSDNISKRILSYISEF